MGISLKNIVLGRPYETSRAAHERLDKVRALAVFASDPISSNAYATEAIMVALLALGTSRLGLTFPIAISIAVLVTIVVLSYNQTIQHYPQGGGAYMVAKDNLGRTPSLVAAGALLTDYALTVSVSVSAGVTAINSAIPAIHPYRVYLGVLIIVLITVVNLRGVRESGSIFAIPTYAFVGGMYVVLGIGLLRYFGILDLGPLESSHAAVEGTAGLSSWVVAWLVLRAFAAGCTALTGIEAISDGVAAFQEPAPKNAIITMRAMAVMAMTLFIGISYLATHLGLQPDLDGHTSLLSQLTETIVGRGPMYAWVQASTMLILVLAANTAYQDFPRLSSFLARDGFLPRWMLNQGHRLVFSTGIISLAVIASLVLVAFQADEIHMLPLYAIGVFVSFTMSQLGMVRLWGRVSRLAPGESRDTGVTVLHHERGWRWKRLLNQVGATTTFIVLLVLTATKFLEGAWVVALMIPALVLFFLRIRRHYDTVKANLRTADLTSDKLAALADVAIVPVGDIHRGSLRAIKVALRMASDVRVVHVVTDPAAGERLRRRWERWAPSVPPAQLIAIDSPYREVIDPLVDYIKHVNHVEFPGQLVMVVVPEFVPESGLANLLHNQTAALLLLRLRDERDVIVMDVPYHLSRPE